MKRVILSVALPLISFLSFSQTHSKPEIMDWIASKIKKYGTGHSTSEGYFRYIDISYENGIILIKGENEGLYKDEITIDLNKASEFFNVGSIYFRIHGINICKRNRKSLRSDITSFTDHYNSASISLDWSQEENLKERMEKALIDLIAILRKERQGKNEPY